MVSPSVVSIGRVGVEARSRRRRRGRGAPGPGSPRRVISQRDVIDWLSAPATHGGAASRIELVETDTSVVVITPTRAYKLKRAVRFDQLDYSTLERRRSACRDEIRLNRRTAPTLYRGVLAITARGNGELELDGSGRVVEWVVDMNRFDPDQRLDRLADRDILDVRMMPGLARAVAALHDVAEWHFGHGGLDGLSCLVRQNRAGFRTHAPVVLDPEVGERLSASCLAETRRQRARLEGRRLAGFVRRGHGDLHLGNVCLVDGEPTLIDCVEFSPTIACVDVMHDLASLLVDLVRRRLDRHANVVLNAYAERTDDLEGLALLPLFQAVQAGARARASAAAAARRSSPAESARLQADARGFLDLAEQLIAIRPPSLVVVGGRPDTGRETLAGGLAPALGSSPGALVLRGDEVRRRVMRVARDARVPDDGYTQGVNHEVCRLLAERARAALRAGQAVIVDAPCGDPMEQATLTDLARTLEVPFTGLWLDAGGSTRTARHGGEPDLVAPPPTWTRLDASGDATRTLDAARRAIATTAS